LIGARTVAASVTGGGKAVAGGKACAEAAKSIEARIVIAITS
jgi:hypothetical protein